MSGYFELLETELRAAVERTANVPSPKRRRVRAWTGGLALAGGVAAALAVTLLAVTMLGHARHGDGRVASSEPGSGSQLGKLLDEHSVLRRPQTPADRSRGLSSRGLSGLVAPGAHVVPKLMRLATTLRDGEQVFVGIESRSVKRAGFAVNSYLLGVWITGPRSYGGATSVSPRTDEGRFPWPLGMRRDPRTRAWVPTYVAGGMMTATPGERPSTATLARRASSRRSTPATSAARRCLPDAAVGLPRAARQTGTRPVSLSWPSTRHDRIRGSLPGWTRSTRCIEMPHRLPHGAGAEQLGCSFERLEPLRVRRRRHERRADLMARRAAVPPRRLASVSASGAVIPAIAQNRATAM
jgi:hypothetical protein